MTTREEDILNASKKHNVSTDFLKTLLDLYNSKDYEHLFKDMEDISIKYLSIYQRNGYNNRADYLKSLSESYGVSEDKVFLCADMLGPNEDFDGLVTMLEDLEMEDEY